MRRGLSRTAALVTLALLIPGCGSNDEPEAAQETTAAPTRLEFLVRADEICLSIETQIEASGDDLFNAPGRPEPAAVREFAFDVAPPRCARAWREWRAMSPTA